MIALLFDHLWQSTLFAGCAGLLTLALRGNGAAARFWLWFAASVKFLLPFAVLVTLGTHVLAPVAPLLQAPGLMRIAPVAKPFSGTDPMLVMLGSAVTSTAARHTDWTILLLALWAGGFALLFLRWMVRWRKLRQLLREAADLGLAAPIAVKSSSSRIEPGLVGILRPVILLPHGIETQLSPAEMHTILAHELCHWRRRDNLLAAIHMLVEALFWFFPLVWWIGAHLNTERERACDETVLSAGGDPTIYAEGILKVCRLYLQSPLACAAGVSGGGLKNRMEAIMENRFLLRLSGLKKSLLATCAATAIAAPLSLGLLTAPPAALARAADAPHPGTEAALRRQIDGWEKRQPALDDMTATMASLIRMQQATMQTMIDGWGPLKAITFKENGPGGVDVYLVEFGHGTSVWDVAPLLAGKIQGIRLLPFVKRTDKGPSPGLADAVRRNYEGLLKGAPAYDLMGQGLLNATGQQLTDLERNAKILGALKTLTFTKINAQGFDVYAATFEKGTATWMAQPLMDGKLNGLLWVDIHEPYAPAHPGTENSVRRYVESLEKGQPNYDEMTPPLAASVRLQLPDLLAMVKSWGALKSIAFQGGGAQGMDVYDVTFEHSKVEWNVGPLTADGKVDRRNFRLLR